MIDMRSHKLIDMIETRQMTQVKSWLKEYPNIKFVSRDGSRAYANAITQAHPKAIQISDRFHLLKNLTDYATLALQKLFQGRITIPITDETQKHRSVMLIGTLAQRVKSVKDLHKNGHSQNEIQQITGASERIVKKYTDMPENGIPAQKQTIRGREHNEAAEKPKRRAELVGALHKEGLGIKQICQKTGFTHKTVQNYLSDNFSPINAHYGKQREGKSEPFRNEILRLKTDGLKYREIHEALKVKGYSGTQDAIRGFVSKERRIQQDLLSASVETNELIDKKWLIRLLYKPIEDVKGISDGQLHFVLTDYPLYSNILCAVNNFKLVLKSKRTNIAFGMDRKNIRSRSCRI